MIDCRLAVILILVCICLISGNTQAQQRLYLSGEDAGSAVDWEFKVSEGRNSGEWTTIPVPSNWEMEGFGYYLYGMDKMEKRKPAVGYYRKTFDLSVLPDKRYMLVFQGAMTDTTAKVNGVKVGFHQGGYTEFKFEITDAVRDGSNLLEVEVNSSSSNASIVEAERFGDYWMFSGIFRPVFIQEVPREFIERVAIDAPMDGAFAMDVFTHDARNGSILSAQVFDAQSNQVGAAFSSPVSNARIRLTASLDDVELWSHEMPNLYTVEVELKHEQQVIHKYRQKFGFRTFEVRDHDGFYLNGKRILLKGASMHSFRPETGRTLSFSDMEENLRWMKELNFNCVRSHCYPPDSHFLDLCDSQGLLVMNEIGGWYRPLDKKIGPEIIKEMVVRDVNHPSIVLWCNGNHKAHVPEFDEVFFKWDIQKRRPLKNEAKTGDIFAKYNPDFDIVNTTFYPGYETLMKRLTEENHIVLPNECLHALYDGGGGANLKTYWDALEASKVGGGLIIWALFDEGLMRTDRGYTVDNQDAKAADGILGPNGEKEGSYYAVREIWSPVVITEATIETGFDGKLEVENKFSFLNLNQCDIQWKLINFANPDASTKGHRTVASGQVTADDISAGTKGTIHIPLPQSFTACDALAVEVRDTQGLLVYEKRLQISKARKWFRTMSSQPFTQQTSVSREVITFRRGTTSLQFDAASGILKSVRDKQTKTSLGNFPRLVFKAAESEQLNAPSSNSSAKVSEKDGYITIEATETSGFDRLKWTLQPNGEVVLDYAYTLPAGSYHYAGIGMDVSADDVLRKRWLGEGPARIWKNRTHGGMLDVYAVDRKTNVPGRVYNPPAFEGCFAPWKWAVFYLKNNQNIAFSNQTDVILGVLNPVNGNGPKKAVWHYPDKEGFYFFDCISSVGSKWKPANEFGPDAQPTQIDKQITGSVSMLFNWNKPDQQAKRTDVEIE